MKKATEETVMCDYYARTSKGLVKEYGEVKVKDVKTIKGFDLPVHKSLNKMFTKK